MTVGELRNALDFFPGNAEIFLDEDGDLEGEDVIKFNEDNKVLEEVKHDEDQAVVYHAVYTYNKNNQVKSKTVYGEKGEFMEKSVFEFENFAKETFQIAKIIAVLNQYE